ncbi:MAG: phytanoyl-CoA dioxygenase family protein [Acetobacteraceae bacterium]
MTSVATDDPADPVEGLLTADEIARYERRGWLIARGFFDASDVAALARWTDELAAAPEEPGRHMVYHEPSLHDPARQVIQRIENFCPYHAGFDALIRRGKLPRALEQLMRAPACLFKEKINFKMAGGSGFEPHQDQQAGWSRYAPVFLTALVCIDRATIENGCLEMAEGSRISGMIGEEWRPITAAEMGALALVPTPTEPGDVLFFDSYVPHASKPNLTSQPRRLLYLTYNRLLEGDHRERYFAEKRASYPPDIERLPGVAYRFRV